MSFAGNDRFEVQRRLGAGGMGVVYKALDRERDAVVAIKLLSRSDAASVQRFKREFRSLANLEHPQLIRLGELIESDGEWFFTMDYVDGLEFLDYVWGKRSRGNSRPTWSHRRVAAEGPLPRARSLASLDAKPTQPVEDPGGPPYDEGRLRNAARQLALAIAALHHAGKVHRDIKPSNVLISANDHLTLLDLGLVRDWSDDLRSSTNAHGVGTAAYMAPEQAVSGAVGPAADWYSLGVILYEALTGRLPHDALSALELLMKKHQYEPPPPRASVPLVPADLDELCVDLLLRDPDRRPAEREVLARLGVDTPVRSATHTVSTLGLTPSAPFVGREAELARLRTAYNENRTRPLIGVVQGESGVGKTEFVRQFVKALPEDADTVLLAGRCYERESVAYKAFDGVADALARFMRTLPDSEAAALLPIQAGLLPRLFPVFQSVEAIAQAPRERDHPDPHEQRRRMFRALRELLVKLSKRHSVVVTIDDLQWVDADSVTLLRELIGHDDAPALLLLMTTRPVDDFKRQQVLDKVLEFAKSEFIELAELSPDQARELAEALLPEGSPELVSRVARESGGHPLFVQELGRSALQEAEVANASLDDILWCRVSALSDELRSVLEVVCVAGRPTRQSIVANALGFDFASISRAIASLRVAFLVRTDGVRRSDTVVAYHDRIAELVMRKLDGERCKHWHNRLAIALERAGAAGFDPQGLVLHAQAAGNLERAAQYARTAAELAVQATAFDQAADLFAIALRLGRFDDEESRRRVQFDLAEALSNSGRGPEAAQVYEEAAADADPATRIECQRRAAEQWLVTGHISRGLEALSVSLAEISESLPGTPRQALVSLLGSRVKLRLLGMRWTPRNEAEVPPTVLNRLDILKAVGHSLASVDNIRGADFNARFLRLALKTGEESRIAWAMGTEAVFVASQGSRAEKRARKLVETVKRLANEHPKNSRMPAWADAVNGWVTYLQGQFEPAEAALHRSETAFQEIAGSTFELNNSRLWRVYCLRHLGRLESMRSAVPVYVRDAEQRGNRFLETSLRRYAVRFLALVANDPESARRELARAAWEPPEGSFHIQHWFELEAIAEIALYEDSVHESAELVASRFVALERSMLLRVQILRSIATWLQARLILASGRKADFSAVSRIARRLEREGVDYARVFALLVRAALDARDPKRGAAAAAAHLRRAIALAEDNAMQPYAAAARHRLGLLTGGDEGAQLLADAETWARQQGIVDSERMMRIFAPGFDS